MRSLAFKPSKKDTNKASRRHSEFQTNMYYELSPSSAASVHIVPSATLPTVPVTISLLGLRVLKSLGDRLAGPSPHRAAGRAAGNRLKGEVSTVLR